MSHASISPLSRIVNQLYKANQTLNTGFQYLNSTKASIGTFIYNTTEQLTNPYKERFPALFTPFTWPSLSNPQETWGWFNSTWVGKGLVADAQNYFGSTGKEIYERAIFAAESTFKFMIGYYAGLALGNVISNLFKAGGLGFIPSLINLEHCFGLIGRTYLSLLQIGWLPNLSNETALNGYKKLLYSSLIIIAGNITCNIMAKAFAPYFGLLSFLLIQDANGNFPMVRAITDLCDRLSRLGYDGKFKQVFYVLALSLAYTKLTFQFDASFFQKFSTGLADFYMGSAFQVLAEHVFTGIAEHMTNPAGQLTEYILFFTSCYFYFFNFEGLGMEGIIMETSGAQPNEEEPVKPAVVNNTTITEIKTETNLQETINQAPVTNSTNSPNSEENKTETTVNPEIKGLLTPYINPAIELYNIFCSKEFFYFVFSGLQHSKAEETKLKKD